METNLVLSFEQASYRMQVLRLRRLAEHAIARYPIRVQSIGFINHGENATFKILSQNGKKFLLRIHRTGYHTPEAIGEELAWLKKLDQTTHIPLPKPVFSKDKCLIESVSLPGIGSRYCCLFEWLEGRFIDRSVSARHLKPLGQIAACLHKTSKTIEVQHRQYWSAEGLLGRKPKFGAIDQLQGVAAKDQVIISAGRRKIFSKLKNFERRFPDRMGLIHADMHFGNILQVNKGIGVIDFDDCGFGFNAYDLVIPLISVEYILKAKGQKKLLPELKAALISGYAEEMPWDQHDEEILHSLTTARKLAMLGWLNSRSDNPKLRSLLKKATRRTVVHLQREAKSL